MIRSSTTAARPATVNLTCLPSTNQAISYENTTTITNNINNNNNNSDLRYNLTIATEQENYVYENNANDFKNNQYYETDDINQQQYLALQPSCGGIISPEFEYRQTQQGASNFNQNCIGNLPTNNSAKERPDSFTLDEIGAIINSEEFGFNLVQDSRDQHGLTSSENRTTNTSMKQELPTPNEEKTKAAIYEHLKASIIEDNEDHHQITSQTMVTMSSNANGGRATANADAASNQHKSNNHNHKYNPTQSTFSNHHQKEASAKPFVEIVEQPAKCALRFRYKCEGRSAGSLSGVNSTADQKTYPSIRINNYSGRAVVVISCVTKDAPYLAHPHNLVGKEGCKKGICTIVISDCEPQMVRSFPGLGIQCVKRKDIEESLTLRESIIVDPYRNGFAHKYNTSNIDLNVVRLCYQVFIEGSTPNKCDLPLQPIVTDAIHDKKAMSDLVITKLSHCSAPATGGREVILLCDRIARDDIQIRFFETQRDGKLVWEHYMDVAPTDVHKQVAICFKSPKYYNENIQLPVMARIQLKRLSDQQVSEPRLFQFLPCESDEDIIQRKRQKIEWVSMNHYALDNILQQSTSTCSVSPTAASDGQHKQQHLHHHQITFPAQHQQQQLGAPMFQPHPSNGNNHLHHHQQLQQLQQQLQQQHPPAQQH